MGCTVTNWEVQEGKTGRLGFQGTALRTLMTPQTKLVVVNFPHNPTGKVLAHGICAPQIGTWILVVPLYKHTMMIKLWPYPGRQSHIRTGSDVQCWLDARPTVRHCLILIFALDASMEMECCGDLRWPIHAECQPLDNILVCPFQAVCRCVLSGMISWGRAASMARTCSLMRCIGTWKLSRRIGCPAHARCTKRLSLYQVAVR